MKRKIAVFVGLVAALSISWFGVLHAANVRSGEAPTVMSNEIVDGTLYTSGTAIRIDGVVQGDLMCVGQTVIITGTVEGDVLCAAQEITINGHVQGSVRLLAQSTTLRGEIDGSASVAGMTLSVGDTAVIAHDFTAATQQTSLDGTIGRDATVIATNFTSGAKVGRDLDVTGKQVTLGSATEVTGDFRYVSVADAAVQSGAKIVGKTDHTVPEHTDKSDVFTPAAYISSVILGVISFSLLGLALVVGSPRVSHAVVGQLKSSPVATAGVGIAGLVVTPIVALMLFITIVGIPLALIMLFVWGAGLLCGLVFSAVWLGQMIMSRIKWRGSGQNVVALFVGLVLLLIVGLMPYVGGPILFVGVVWGSGAIWYAAIKHRLPLRPSAKSKGETS